MVNCYAGYTVSERRGTSPSPPSKGEEEIGPHRAQGLKARHNSIVNGQLLIVMQGYPNANNANNANESK